MLFGPGGRLGEKRLLVIVGAFIVIGAAVGGAQYYAYPVQVTTVAGMTRIIWATTSAGTTSAPAARA
jgi:hypothetical protein